MSKIKFIHSYHFIISLDNLLEAWQEFLKGKRNRKDVQEFELNLMANILSLHKDLIDKTYRHLDYHAFNISDPKPRNIHKASVRDRLLHHALYRQLYPFFDRTFIYDSYSCRIDKGTHKAMNRFRELAFRVSKNHTKTVWVLKCDIKKFFASVDHSIIKKIINNYIPDQDIKWLLWQVIDSFETSSDKGLPLGNLTSQLLVNVYMNELDQYMKHNLKAKYYIRYADDFAILSDDKRYLKKMLVRVDLFLRETLKLNLHPSKISISTLASYVNYGAQVWREIFSIDTFKKEDYGHLDFFQALLALHKEKFIEIISLHFLDVREDTLTIKIEVDYKKIPEEKPTSKNIKNPYSDRIKNIRDLMRDCSLVKKFRGVFMYGDGIERGHRYTIPTDEKNDSFISLLIDLGLAEYNWDALNKQTHREVGNRIIEFSFNADSIIDVFDQLNGTGAFIQKKSLKYISQQIADFDTGANLAELLQNWGVPKPLIDYPNTKWMMINTVLTYYATSEEKDEQKMLFKILEEAVHPLMHNGNKEKSIELQDNFSIYLQYDGYCFSNGKIVKATNNLIKEIDKRQKDRANQPVDPALQDLLSNFFTPPKQEQKTTEPIPIKIVEGKVEVDGLKNGLNSITKSTKQKDPQKFPYKLPSGTQWQNIAIKFEDEEKVFIQAKQYKLYTDYKEMGFVGRGKNPNPSEAWTFLKVLSLVNGELTIKDAEAKNKYKKQKELLAKSLKNYFSIDYDPFYPYKSSPEKQGNSYKIKLTLIPPPDKNDIPSDEEDEDILSKKEYLP